MNTVFKFKQFEVDQQGCAMKINTDGVLLGALAGAGKPETILDIGTGTGVIALMLAQRFSEANIAAVEIDKSAAHTARKNFEASAFNERLMIEPTGFEAYFERFRGWKYDLVLSNPPFYIDALQSPEEKKNTAKHAGDGFFERLVGQVADHLTEAGEFWLILPLPTSMLVKTLAGNYGLFVKQIIYIHSYPESPAHREIVVLTKTEAEFTGGQLVIYEAFKKYSAAYQEALKDFFTIF